MAQKVSIPHFRYPFQFGAGLDKHALANEQDSDEDVLACVLALLKTPEEWRVDLPEFGTPEAIFEEQPISVKDIERALDVWEERAAYRVTTEPDYRDNLIARILIEFQGTTDA